LEGAHAIAAAGEIGRLRDWKADSQGVLLLTAAAIAVRPKLLGDHGCAVVARRFFFVHVFDKP
jgi:hypothetical protein